MAERTRIGWDIGGAHVKACRMVRGEVVAVAQWPCPLWQGLQHLQRVLAQAAAEWPDLGRAHHAVTMTGEMVDHFADRADGVNRIAALLAAQFERLHFFAGDAHWCRADAAAALWPQIASANWLASARHCAQQLPHEAGVWVDIGSTTTDLVVFDHGLVPTASRSDAQRLASGELVYQGVVRTPLCALAQRVPWRGARVNVMNEWFASTADVYRLTGELDPAHDQQPSADGGPKDSARTQARLARMIGLDARDGSAAEWLALARHWRALQLRELRAQLDRVLVAQPAGARVLVAAGCGGFLAAELAGPGARCLDYGRDVARVCAQAAPGVAAWATVCAPCVAVAALAERELV